MKRKKASKVLSPTLFAMLVLMAIITTMAFPILPLLGYHQTKQQSSNLIELLALSD